MLMLNVVYILKEMNFIEISLYMTVKTQKFLGKKLFAQEIFDRKEIVKAGKKGGQITRWQ